MKFIILDNCIENIYRSFCKGETFLIFKLNRNLNMVFSLLKVLAEEDLIKSFFYDYQNKEFNVIINQNFKFNKLFKFKKKIFNYNVLKAKIHLNPTSIYIVSTSEGFCSNSNIFLKKIGGILFCKIN